MNQRGVTLLELMVAVAILGILATMAMPSFQQAYQRNRETELRTALREIRTAIDAYKKASDEGRIARATQSGYPPSLSELVRGAEDLSDAKHRRLRFLPQIPADPFNPQAKTDPEAAWGKRSYASPPEAPQEGADVFDVYSNTAGTGTNGLPYRKW
ncbi:type II secretion system protein [Niveibacterium sp. SC-1]|uniref:type II secretion system protein n=1 Tax=Niveibacterium sp. SC-1 TaxID=3135646 RepID=UPI00311FFAB5